MESAVLQSVTQDDTGLPSPDLHLSAAGLSGMYSLETVYVTLGLQARARTLNPESWVWETVTLPIKACPQLYISILKGG